MLQDNYILLNHSYFKPELERVTMVRMTLNKFHPSLLWKGVISVKVYLNVFQMSMNRGREKKF